MAEQSRRMAFEGEVAHHLDVEHDTEWVTLNGRTLIDMLRRMGYHPSTLKEHARLRITIEVIEPAKEFY